MRQEVEKKAEERQDLVTRRTILRGALWTFAMLMAHPIIPFRSYVGASSNPSQEERTMREKSLLVAVKGGSYEERVDRAIEALGGINRWVNKGSRVLVKPNIGWNVPPEGAANTHPRVVKRIVEHCITAGAREVIVFDHTCDSWQAAYRNSGIEEAVKSAGGKMIPGNSEDLYEKMKIPRASTLKEVKVHGEYMNADVVINVPILKHHSGAGMTCALKNLMGVVWDRGFYHLHGLDTCIAEFSLVRVPNLTIVDAGIIMKTGGPRGNPKSVFERQDMLIASSDPVICDVAAAFTLGKRPEELGYIEEAANLGIGTNIMDKVEVRRISI
ncbi:MAG: DUF362 domain-containing protein [Syntrophobacterales bacterium]|nr:DUF362 domain-containing protein [Syntrophobacterales bacterium]